MKPIIRVLDTIHCKANKEARSIILPALAYKAIVSKRNPFGGRQERQVKQHLITGRKGTGGTFFTGLLPRVKKYCKQKGKTVRVIGRQERIMPARRPKLKGITFRPDQKKALRAVAHKARGRIVFPTGSGKTIIVLGIISMFENVRTLFLCHTLDLLMQLEEEAKKYFEDVFVISGKSRPTAKQISKHEDCIVISTIQSFVKYPKKWYSTFFDLLLVDEVHHANAKKSQYGTVIQNLLAPLRYGCTATTPTKEKQFLINEGFFGEVIAQLTEEEGQAAGIIAKIDINLVPVPYDTNLNVRCKNRYKNYYSYGIVRNRSRNKAIINEIKQSLQAKEQVLVIVEAIKHGKILKKMIQRKLKIDCDFVYGGTAKEKRSKVKRRMKSGKLNLAICSRVWKEGINIPSLNHIINACGMKEEKAVIQALGRGLRTTENKDRVKLTDFLDPYRYLAEHSILRIQVYARKGWI